MKILDTETHVLGLGRPSDNEVDSEALESKSCFSFDKFARVWVRYDFFVRWGAGYAGMEIEK